MDSLTRYLRELLLLTPVTKGTQQSSLSLTKLTTHHLISSSRKLVILSNSLPHEILSVFNSNLSCSSVKNVDYLTIGKPSSSLTTSSDFRNESLLFPSNFLQVAIDSRRICILASQQTFICFILFFEGKSCYFLVKSFIYETHVVNVLR
jgi:hypothetical protein